MAPEQKRTSSDEEVDKILAELGISGMSAPKTEPAVNTARSSVPSRPKQQSAAAPAQKDDGFQIDLDAFDDIKKDAAPRAASPAEAPKKKQQPVKRAPSGGKNASGQARSASRTSSSPKRSARGGEQGSSHVDLNVTHHASHLKDELEKMAVSSSTQTGQLTKQLRAGRKLEEITASLPAQQRQAKIPHPSERVQKAAAFAAAVAAEQPQKKSVGKIIRGWLIALVVVAAIIFALFYFVIHIVTVQGSSMSPTLEQGDRVVISGLLYTPQQGDIVVTSDNNALKKQLIKRVIATAGQTVEIDAEGNVIVDGNVLEEEYLAGTTASAGDMFYPVTLGENEVFVLGDNRDHSLDSRQASVGLIDVSDIKGRVLFRFYPFGSFGGVD